jgi:xanthine/uracil/vitamin C permease (AzgA family)
MLLAFATPPHRRVTLLLLAVACLAVTATLALGLANNAPAHLFYASGLGFGAFVVLHSLSEAGAVATANAWPLHPILQGLSVVVFLAAIIVCPAALVVSLGGALILFFIHRNVVGRHRLTDEVRRPSTADGATVQHALRRSRPA